MKQWIIRFLQLSMAISLLAMPATAAPCSPQSVSHTGMSCCGPACHCPTGKMCSELPMPKSADRTAVQPVQKVTAPVAVLLFALPVKSDTLSSPSAQLAQVETRPPPMMVGSPPQAQLRSWLI